jgi:hypothetical protein
MHSRIKLCLAIGCMFALFGCVKKQDKQAQQSAAGLPELKQETSAVKKDSGDVFNEFYDESGSKSAKKELAKGKAQKGKTTFDEMGEGNYTFAPDGRFVVQISCVISRGLADRLVKKMEEKNFPAYVAEVVNPTPDLQGTYYRVRIGGFNGVSAARAFAEKALVPEGYQYWVDNRSNDAVGMSGSGLGETAPSSYSSPASSPAPAAPSTSSESWVPGSSSGASSSSSAASEWSQPAATPTTPAAAPASQPAAVAPSTPAASASQPAASSTTPAPAPVTQPSATSAPAPGSSATPSSTTPASNVVPPAQTGSTGGAKSSDSWGTSDSGW